MNKELKKALMALRLEVDGSIVDSITGIIETSEQQEAIGFAEWLGEYCIQYIDNANVWTYTKDNKDYSLNELYVIKSHTDNQK